MRSKQFRETSLPISQTRQGSGRTFSTGLAKTRDTGYDSGSSADSMGLTPLSKQPDSAKRPIVTIGTNNRFVSSSQQITTQASILLGANPNRSYLLIQNGGAVSVFLGFGTNPLLTGQNAIEVPSGFQISFEDGIVPNNEIRAISPATLTLGILEGNRW